MDKRFIVVFGMMVKRAEELWSVIFCCQKSLIQTKEGAYNPTQLHTSWYLKAWIQLKVIENELQNTIVKFYKDCLKLH
jgi:hypothetical protein